MKTYFKVSAILVIFAMLMGSLGAPTLALAWEEPFDGGQSQTPQAPDNPYFTQNTFMLSDGTAIDEMIISGPPSPPPGYGLQRTAVNLPVPNQTMASSTLSVPAYDWVFGCSAVSAAMIAGYYDQAAYPNLYSGPTNGGVMPMTNSPWGTWPDSVGYFYPQNPLIASRQGLDGRGSRGSLDDYWVALNNYGQDPYITNGWTQHAWGDAIGDYMKTSQSAYGNGDGSTVFFNYTASATRLTCSAMESAPYGGQFVSSFDGTYGRKLFYQAKGYTVTDCYNQYTDNTVAGGFSFAQFKAEIDAGRPVLLNLEGHSIVGVGYNDIGNTVYVHDTWDSETYSMTWGSYYYLPEYVLISVSIVNLAPPPSPPGAFDKSGPSDGATGQPTNPTLTWGSSSGATGYQYCINDSGSSCTNWLPAPLSTSVQLSGLDHSTTYYWQVMASNSSGTAFADGSEANMWSFTTVAANNPPNTPSSPTPANGASGIGLNPGLSWSGGDPDAGDSVTYSVYLQAGVNPPTSQVSTGQTGTSYSSGPLSPGVTYYWKVVATDSDTASSSGPVWSFTTQPVPGAFNKSSPVVDAVDQPTNPTLAWTTSSGATGYQYCINDTGAPCTSWQAANLSTSVQLNGLSHATTYYWQVKASNSSGTTYANGSETDVRSFTTLAGNNPPNVPKDPTPANGSTGIGFNPSLSWSGGDPDAGDSVAYSVYLQAGVNPPTSLVSTEQTGTGFSPSSLLPGIQYFWKVVATDSHEASTSGPVWSFTTQAAAPLPPGPFSKSSPENGLTNQQTELTLTWESTTPLTRYEYCIDTSSDMSCTDWQNAGLDNSVTISGLAYGTRYYWQVRAWNDSAGPVHTNSGEWWTFQVKPEDEQTLGKAIYLPFVVQ